MIEENPQKIDQAEIIVGIPSYNEANSIGQVVEVVDAGLTKYFASKKAVIINADNHSADETKAAFLNTKTKTAKIYLSTPQGVKGKGHNIYNIFLKAKQIQALSCMLIDADMKSASPQWVKCLVEPVLKDYDYISPLYYRDKYDGSITNNICYPLVYGLLGYDLRQPIGGEVSFSRKMIDYWLAQKWPAEAKLFGIDIFMFFMATLSGFQIGAVDLGKRIHKPSLPKLDFMFNEVTSTLFSLLANYQPDWAKETELKQPAILCSSEDNRHYPDISLKSAELKDKSLAGFEQFLPLFEGKLCPDLQADLKRIYLTEKSAAVDSRLWVRVVYQSLKIFIQSSQQEEIVKFLRALYFGRLSHFVEETADKSQDQAEALIKEQAKLFYQQRNILISSLGSGK